MPEKFSSLEIALIKSSIGTKTDQEIAEILERPVDEVRDYLNDFTGSSAEDREMEANKFKEEKQAAKKKPAKVKKLPYPNKKERVQKIKRAEADQAWMTQKRTAAAREERMKFQTRPVNLDKLHSLRIDSKTTVFYSDQELEQFIRETKTDKKAFHKHLQSKYQAKYETTIQQLKKLSY